jgi:predicted PurR-regulated permease PerM
LATFSFSQFYRLNRRIVIWAVLLALLWVLRGFFGLVFLTFLLAFVASAVAEFGNRRLRLPYSLSLVLTYLLFLAALVGFVRFVAPNVAGEAMRLIGNLPSIEQRLVEVKDDLVQRYPAARQPITAYLWSALDEPAARSVGVKLASARAEFGLTEQEVAESISSDAAGNPALQRYRAREDQILVHALLTRQFDEVRQHTPVVINYLYRTTGTTLLALLFSFLILFDLRRLTRHVQEIGTSRLRDFYEEAAEPVVRFGQLLGHAIQAQAAIACVNTALTAIGLAILGVPSLAMLSVIVFVCSFIPVLGVFLSTAPIVLVALNAGGLGMSLSVVALIIAIHAVEAYLLNPLIYGHHLKLNPVVTLIILFAAHHVAGFWGLILAVPVARYFITDVFGIGTAQPASARTAA